MCPGRARTGRPGGGVGRAAPRWWGVRRAGQCAGRRVGDGGVGGAQVGAAEPEGGGRFGAAAGGQGGQFRRAPAARGADQGQDAGRARCRSARLERLEVPGDSGARYASGVHRGRVRRRQPGRSREVQVRSVGRHRRRVAVEECGERAAGAGQRHREPGRPVRGVQGGAEDAEHGTGRGVEHGAAGRSAAGAQRVGAGGADGQFEDAVEEMAAVRRGVRGGGRPEDACLAPAAGGDPDVRAPAGLPAGGDRQRAQAQPLRAHEGEAEPRQPGDRLAGDLPLGPGGPEEEGGQAVDRLVAGDERARVVHGEAGAARPSGRVEDLYEEVRRGRRVLDPLEGAVPSRHVRRTSRRAFVPDGRRAVIGGTGFRANAPPSTPPVHSERPPKGVTDRARTDTPWCGGNRGGPWSGDQDVRPRDRRSTGESRDRRSERSARPVPVRAPVSRTPPGSSPCPSAPPPAPRSGPPGRRPPRGRGPRTRRASPGGRR